MYDYLDKFISIFYMFSIAILYFLAGIIFISTRKPPLYMIPYET